MRADLLLFGDDQISSEDHVIRVHTMYGRTIFMALELYRVLLYTLGLAQLYKVAASGLAEVHRQCSNQ